MLSREQLEAFLKCEESSCGDCTIYSICNASSNLSDDATKTALELMEKLEKAKKLLKSYEICSCCLYKNNKLLIELTKEHPCVLCQSKKDGDLWEFNDLLLEE